MLPLLRTLIAPLALLVAWHPAAASPCQLSDEELVATTTWQAEGLLSAEPVTYTEYYYHSPRSAVLQGSELSAKAPFVQLREMVAAKTETNAMVLLDRYYQEQKSRDPDSADVANARLVLEHQAGQVFQISCAESIVLARLLSTFSTRKVEVGYYLFANAESVRLYFALPDRLPSQRLTLRSDLAAEHLASGELDDYDFRVVGYSQGFRFAQPFAQSDEVSGGELVPSHQLLPELTRLAARYNAQIAMTNGFETMSFDSYELSLMNCPLCRKAKTP